MRTKGAGSLRRKGPSSWLVRWTDRNADGESERHARIVKGTKLDAERKLAELLDRKARGAYAAPTKETLGDYMAEWLEAKAKRGELCTRTATDYRLTLSRYVLPMLADRRLEDLQPRDLSKLYAAMMAEERDEKGKVTKRGVGPRTVQYTHGILRNALRDAVRENRLAAAVTDRVRVPKQIKHEVRALSPDEVNSFRTAARESKHGVLFDFLLGTGARPGEALALRWSDVDLDAGTARIERALSRPGFGYEIREPKTEKSRRVLALPPGLVQALKEHRRAQAEQRLELGPDWHDQDLVFAGPLGTPADFQQINRRALKTTCKRAGLPVDVSLYSLRHTFATLALAAGASIHEVASAMGHTSPQLVLSTYGHAIPERKAEVFSKVGALVFG